MTMLHACPVCGRGHLTPQVSTNSIVINGETYELPCYYAVCNTCECEVADADDAAENKRLMMELRKRLELSLEEYIKCLQKEN